MSFPVILIGYQRYLVYDIVFDISVHIDIAALLCYFFKVLARSPFLHKTAFKCQEKLWLYKTSTNSVVLQCDIKEWVDTHIYKKVCKKYKLYSSSLVFINLLSVIEYSFLNEWSFIIYLIVYILTLMPKSKLTDIYVIYDAN